MHTVSSHSHFYRTLYLYKLKNWERGQSRRNVGIHFKCFFLIDWFLLFVWRRVISLLITLWHLRWGGTSILKAGLAWFMVFNATFNNISVISWRSVLLVEETGGPGENHRPVGSHWQTLVSSAHHLSEIRIHNIGTDRIGNYKSNYHTITTTTAYSTVGY